jgi:uncharacterized protein YndB with AHSA1/START domain
MIHVEREITIAASRHRVWEILADHEGMPAWFPVREVIRRRPGSPDLDGVGAVRVVRMSGLAIEERVTASKTDERLEYTVVAGAPLRDHRGVVVLSPHGGGTRVHWSIELRPLVPGTGWLLRRSVDRMLERGLVGLRRAAESPS